MVIMATTASVPFPTPGGSLGLKVKDGVALHEKILGGFPFAALKRFEKQSELPAAAILEVIDLPARTLARRKAAGKLHPDESDRLYRLARVFERAVELFEGDRAEAARWLTTPRPALGGPTPLSLVRTEVGAREVEALIHKLEHGVFV